MSAFSFILNSVPRPWLIKMSYWVRPLFRFYLRGNRYEDPIDKRTFRKFLPYGYVTQRPNVLSPSTLSLERHRLLWLYLTRKTDFFSRKISVLHVAPEQAFHGIFKKHANWQYITTDLFSPLADVKADLCNLPFADNSFDLILCNHVLEHIKDDTKAMQELFRVLKKGGTGIFQVPLDNKRTVTFEDDSITNPAERSRIFGQYDHVRIYGMDYFTKLETIGFQVTASDFAATLPAEQIDRYRIVADELLPICLKP